MIINVSQICSNNDLLCSFIQNMIETTPKIQTNFQNEQVCNICKYSFSRSEAIENFPRKSYTYESCYEHSNFKFKPSSRMSMNFGAESTMKIAITIFPGNISFETL